MGHLIFDYHLRFCCGTQRGGEGVWEEEEETAAVLEVLVVVVFDYPVTLVHKDFS